MIDKLYIKIISIIIELVDYSNKKKIINFFKKHFIHKEIIAIDIGAHKGETIDLFYKNFNIKKILAFEPNIKLYNLLIKKKKYDNERIILLNHGVGVIEEKRELNILIDSASSTFNTINLDSDYYKKKNKIVTFLSGKKELFEKKQQISIVSLSKIILENKIEKIDILKIDTEGFELNVLKGIRNHDFKKIKFIYFEHHYDLMINKGYSFSDINKLLIKNKFQQKYKLRMKFRKSFEYIYENTN